MQCIACDQEMRRSGEAYACHDCKIVYGRDVGGSAGAFYLSTGDPLAIAEFPFAENFQVYVDEAIPEIED